MIDSGSLAKHALAEVLPLTDNQSPHLAKPAENHAPHSRQKQPHIANKKSPYNQQNTTSLRNQSEFTSYYKNQRRFMYVRA